MDWDWVDKGLAGGIIQQSVQKFAELQINVEDLAVILEKNDVITSFDHEKITTSSKQYQLLVDSLQYSVIKKKDNFKLIFECLNEFGGDGTTMAKFLQDSYMEAAADREKISDKVVELFGKVGDKTVVTVVKATEKIKSLSYKTAGIFIKRKSEEEEEGSDGDEDEKQSVDQEDSVNNENQELIVTGVNSNEETSQNGKYKTF
jgi:hypothetical protein